MSHLPLRPARLQPLEVEELPARMVDGWHGVPSPRGSPWEEAEHGHEDEAMPPEGSVISGLRGCHRDVRTTFPHSGRTAAPPGRPPRSYPHAAHPPLRCFHHSRKAATTTTNDTTIRHAPVTATALIRGLEKEVKRPEKVPCAIRSAAHS